MSLQKYLALLKTVELGSISLAAEQMGYTQPAVSRMIADLEAQWKVELLRRNRSGLEPSAACLQLLPILRSLQADCDALNFAVSEIHGAHTGLVRVGIFTSVADMWIPGLMKSFRQQYPKIEFELINMESYVEIESNIRQGKVDCGFVRLPTAHDLQVHFLMRDELVAVLPPDHPDLATSYSNVGGSYLAMGDHEKTLEYVMKAHRIRERVLPGNHPDLAQSFNNIAWTYYALGRIGEAATHMRRAAEIINRSTLPETHPDRVNYNKWADRFERKAKRRGWLARLFGK
jgi:tetratricopeptide (TPR) repeat protein